MSEEHGEKNGSLSQNMLLHGGKSNLGLPRAMQGYSPLYYRGLMTFGINTLRTGDISVQHPKERWDVPRGEPRDFG